MDTIVEPVNQEEFFLRREKSFGLADDGTQCGGHLHGNEQENDDPDIYAGLRPRVGLVKTILAFVLLCVTKSQDRGGSFPFKKLFRFVLPDDFLQQVDVFREGAAAGRGQ